MKYMFTAKWCGNCQLVKNFDYPAWGVEVIDVDTLEGMTLAEELGVMSLPTFVNNENKIVGARSEEEIKKFFDEKIE